MHLCTNLSCKIMVTRLCKSLPFFHYWRIHEEKLYYALKIVYLLQNYIEVIEELSNRKILTSSPILKTFQTWSMQRYSDRLYLFLETILLSQFILFHQPLSYYRLVYYIYYREIFRINVSILPWLYATIQLSLSRYRLYYPQSTDLQVR